uniref:superoxide dismutase n=1 Tax=Cydia pomonella granulosis virus TaxID=28289 RepID=A0A097P135_GVCP|nr:ORF59 sod [Cydia pomonella granulovirus]
MKGVCIICGDVEGVVEFVQDKPNSEMRVLGVLYNLPKGNHGMHVHEYGDTSNGCTSAGEHFNPHHMNHGAPQDTDRHLGDLGNIYSVGAHTPTRVNLVDNMISLYGAYSILGRSLVVHTMEDDCGRGCNKESLLTGNSGGRLGCGVIGVSYERTVNI